MGESHNQINVEVIIERGKKARTSLSLDLSARMFLESLIVYHEERWGKSRIWSDSFLCCRQEAAGGPEGVGFGIWKSQESSGNAISSFPCLLIRDGRAQLANHQEAGPTGRQRMFKPESWNIDNCTFNSENQTYRNIFSNYTKKSYISFRGSRN